MTYRVRVQPTDAAVDDRRTIFIDTDDERTARSMALEQCGGGSVVWATHIEQTEEGASNPAADGATNG